MTLTHDAAALVDDLDRTVRELVRREGVDPQRDAAVVRRIAELVVREHDERSLTGVVAPVADAGALVGELVARVSGFGPLQPFLDDPSVEEVWINDPTMIRKRYPAIIGLSSHLRVRAGLCQAAPSLSTATSPTACVLPIVQVPPR